VLNAFPPVLKASLRGLFKSYGEVIDVVAHNNLRMRGQAFVSFASADIAQKALKEVKGFPLYSKPMVRISLLLLLLRTPHPSPVLSYPYVRFQQISFAKTRSDAVVKRLDAEHYEEHRQRRMQHKSVCVRACALCSHHH
jgi:U2 small nuclear ribonucleoprotein B''